MNTGAKKGSAPTKQPSNERNLLGNFSNENFLLDYFAKIAMAASENSVEKTDHLPFIKQHMKIIVRSLICWEMASAMRSNIPRIRRKVDTFWHLCWGNFSSTFNFLFDIKLVPINCSSPKHFHLKKNI